MKKKLDGKVLPKKTELLNMKEVMEMLRCKKTKLYSLLSSGQIRFVKVGRSTFFLPSDVANFIEKNTY